MLAGEKITARGNESLRIEAEVNRAVGVPAAGKLALNERGHPLGASYVASLSRSTSYP